MLTTLQTLRYAFRQLRRAPGFAVLAISTLGLGIGATTAVFSLVDTILLRPLPLPEPDRLVALDTLSQPRGGSGPSTVPSETSYPNFFDWRDRSHSFDSLASWQGSSFTLSGPTGPAQRIDGLFVSADFLRVLGIRPSLGRDFNRIEEQPGARAALLSNSLWQRAFHGDPATLGQTLHLNDEIYTVIGVLPASFQFPNAPDAQVLLTPSLKMEGKNPSGKQRGWNQLSVLGRLAPGVSIPAAFAEMQTVQRSLALQYPEDLAQETAVSLRSAQEDLVGDLQSPLRLLFASVAVLLLICGANVAGLLLTHIAGRRAELALRSALGATRPQIIVQILLESLTLSLAGGLAGLLLAALALNAAPHFLPSDLPRLSELAINPRIFLFALAVSIVTGLLFGVVPAWRSSRLDPALALRETTRSTTAGHSRYRLRNALVIGETALGLVLLVGAGLLIRSFDRLLSVDPGFRAQHLLTFSVAMPAKRFQEEQLLQLTQQLQARFATLPGVQQSTYAFPMPLSGTNMEIAFTLPGHPVAPGHEPSSRVSLVTANFFQAMQITLRRGRFFDSTNDRPGSSPVVIINQAFADRYFPGEDPLTRYVQSDLSSSDKPEPRAVVGVVGNVNRGSLNEAAEPEYYIPFGQVAAAPPIFALRVNGDPATYINTVRAAVAQQDASLPVYAVRTNLLTRSTAQQRFQTVLVSIFAVIALLLAAFGLFGALSYMVAQRTAELGLRIALGAQRSDVLLLILHRGLLLCGAGIVLGLLASTALTRYLATLLFRTPALDPLTLASTTTLLLLVSMAACLLPAWRAASCNPIDTLRQQ